MTRMTKEEIRATALRLFLEKGYNNVTITDICEACGFTKPTFYKYVSSKEDLILDLYDLTIDQLTTDTYLFIQANTHYEQLLIVFGTLINDSKKFGTDLFSQMLISNLNENRGSFEMRNSLTKVCTAILEKAQENGEIGNMNPPDALYQAVAHLFTGYEVMWCITNGKDYFDGFYESMNAVLDVREDLRDLYRQYI